MTQSHRRHCPGQGAPTKEEYERGPQRIRAIGAVIGQAARIRCLPQRLTHMGPHDGFISASPMATRSRPDAPTSKKC